MVYRHTVDWHTVYMHFTLYCTHCTLYCIHAHCTVYMHTVLYTCTLYCTCTAHCTVQYTCMLHTVPYTCTAHCTVYMHAAHCTVYMHAAHCTVYMHTFCIMAIHIPHEVIDIPKDDTVGGTRRSATVGPTKPTNGISKNCGLEYSHRVPLPFCLPCSQELCLRIQPHLPPLCLPIAVENCG